MSSIFEKKENKTQIPEVGFGRTFRSVGMNSFTFFSLIGSQEQQAKKHPLEENCDKLMAAAAAESSAGASFIRG
ncbi:MAG: hypothetical protein ACI8RD_003107 [Bacillariaceae sp.]